MPNGTYGGVRGRKTKVGRKLLRFPPTRFLYWSVYSSVVIHLQHIYAILVKSLACANLVY